MALNPNQLPPLVIEVGDGSFDWQMCARVSRFTWMNALCFEEKCWVVNKERMYHYDVLDKGSTSYSLGTSVDNPYMAKVLSGRLACCSSPFKLVVT